MNTCYIVTVSIFVDFLFYPQKVMKNKIQIMERLRIECDKPVLNKTETSIPPELFW